MITEFLCDAQLPTAPDRLRRQVEWMLGLLPVLDFDEAAATHAADIRAELAKAGSPIGAYDVLIAGHARSRGIVVVTENLKNLSGWRGSARTVGERSVERVRQASV